MRGMIFELPLCVPLVFVLTSKKHSLGFMKSSTENTSAQCGARKTLEPVPHHPSLLVLVRRVLQTLVPAASAGVSKTDERWHTFSWHVAIVDRYSYSLPLI
jgi:hypothetical protein